MIPPGNDVILGTVAGASAPLVLPRTARDKHLYVCGSTGTGKSKFLENLIRQDIRSWSKSKCGVMLIDPHGSLYDGVMRWLANREIDRPVIPIDLRRDDWVIGYNVLRKRPQSDPSVIARNFVDAMAHVWGQAGTDQTPLFARWAGNILSTLYEAGETLVQAEHLIHHSAKHTRKFLTRQVTNRSAMRDWEYAASLTPKDFEALISSTVNRLRPFLSTNLIRQMFGQLNSSLDLGEALEKGHIILVCLATERSRISEEDSALVATLLLSDLWASAKARGKGGNGVPPKPFYLYVDEFQNFITPTIAKNLDQARGFGLHLTLAHQFPNQLIHAGPNGRQVLDSIFENARTKAVFALESEENLRPLAQILFRGNMSPDKIRRELYSTKVLGYSEELRTIIARGRAFGSGATKGQGRAQGAGLGGTQVFTGNELYLPTEMVDPTSVSYSDSTFESESESSSQSWSQSDSESEARVPMLVPHMGRELSSVENESIEDQLFRAMSALSDQQQRHFIARVVGERIPLSVKTPTLTLPAYNAEAIEEFTQRQLAKWPFAIPAERAAMQIAEREKTLLAVPAVITRDEPVTNRRRIRERDILHP